MQVTDVSEEKWLDALSLILCSDGHDRFIDAVVGHCAGTGRHLDAERVNLIRESRKTALMLNIRPSWIVVDKLVHSVWSQVIKINLES